MRGRLLSKGRRWAAAGLITRLKPRHRVAAITALALAAIATFAGLTGSDAFDARYPQKASMIELFTSYDAGTGLIGNHWWQSAVALSTVETYAQTTGDTGYDVAIARAFAVNSSAVCSSAAIGIILASFYSAVSLISVSPGRTKVKRTGASVIVS